MAAEPERRSVDDRRYVIPPGTGDRAKAGLSVSDVLPRIVSTRVGQTLVVENEDTMRHVFGPFVLEPGQSWSRAFASAGDYALDCSIYPTAGFTIEVSPPEGAIGVIERTRRGWLGVLAVAAGAFAAGSGLAALGFVRPASLAALAALLLASAVGLAVLGASALSRVAAWGPVLGSRSMIAWGAAALFALAAALWTSRMSRAGAATRVVVLPAFGLSLFALTLALWPDLDLALAARTAFLIFGASLLCASLLVNHGRGESPDEPSRERSESRSESRPRSRLGLRPWRADGRGAGRLAAIGLVLFVAGLPPPPSTPPAVALLAMPGLALGIGLLTWSVRRASLLGGDGAWFAGAAGMAVILLQTAVLWSAILGHLDAVTLPAWGNPVPVDEASVQRGEALFNDYCSACHAAGGPMGEGDDIALLELITHGHATAPGLAYEIDVYGRGDIVNFLRASAAAE